MVRLALALAACLVMPLTSACGGSSGSAAHHTTDAGGGDGGIPGPGTGDQVNVDWADVEPNDTPAEATPLGVAKSGDLVIWVGDNSLGGSDNQADYFVFESGPAQASLEFNMCYAGALTGVTATLWKVAGGQAVEPAVATWSISTSCSNSFSAVLDASQEYMFGVLATGGPGMYTA